jgi:Effector-associated domain 1
MERRGLGQPNSSTRRQFLEALLSAFPKRDALAEMVSLGLNENLNEIAGEGDLRSTVFKLLTWAEAHGRLLDLIESAVKANPQNLQLRALSGDEVPLQPPPLPLIIPIGHGKDATTCDSSSSASSDPFNAQICPRRAAVPRSSSAARKSQASD